MTLFFKLSNIIMQLITNMSICMIAYKLDTQFKILKVLVFIFEKHELHLGNILVCVDTEDDNKPQKKKLKASIVISHKPK